MNIVEEGKERDRTDTKGLKNGTGSKLVRSICSQDCGQMLIEERLQMSKAMGRSKRGLNVVSTICVVRSG